jgi:hypothetical protein
MFSKANKRPINYNRSRRLPRNGCLLCGAPLGNFNPVKSLAAIGPGSGKLEGWVCPCGCGSEDEDEYEDDEYV